MASKRRTVSIRGTKDNQAAMGAIVDALRPSNQLKGAVACAIQEPTLADALTYVCVWESERVVRQARANAQWDTCFKRCIEAVLEAWEKKHG